MGGFFVDKKPDLICTFAVRKDGIFRKERLVGNLVREVRTSEFRARLIGLLVAALAAGSVVMCFRLFEFIGRDEIAVMDCGCGDMRVKNGESGILPNYVGFCDLTLYEKKMKVSGTFRVALDGGHPAEVTYDLRIEMPTMGSFALRAHDMIEERGGPHAFEEVIRNRVEFIVMRLLKKDEACADRDYCLSLRIDEELEPDLFNDYGIRLYVEHVFFYRP